MVLVGESPCYLSHLPMFMSPHNYQVVLKCTLDNDASGRLRELRTRLGRDVLVTVKPEVFAITDLMPVDAARQVLTEFNADVVEGHFEHGGRTLAPAAVVNVDEVMYFCELDLGAASPDERVGEMEYLLFGDADDELFLAHRIGSRPNFDQVLRITAEGVQFTASEIERQGHPTVTVVGRQDAFGERVRPGEVVSAQSSAGQHFHHDVQITAESEIYANEDELR
jgi:hypothetical protein